MLPLRTRIFIIVSLVVLLILGISILLLVFAKKKAAIPTTPEGGAPTNGSQTVIDSSNFNQGSLPNGTAVTPAPAGVPIKPLTTLETEQNGVKQLAKIFVERYNTFSTENNSQNIKEVSDLVTPTLWKKLSGYIGKGSSSTFVGVTTVVISTTLDSWKEIAASLTLKTRRTTEKNGVITTDYQTFTVSMVKQGSSWLVDSYTIAK